MICRQEDSGSVNVFVVCTWSDQGYRDCLGRRRDWLLRREGEQHFRPNHLTLLPIHKQFVDQHPSPPLCANTTYEPPLTPLRHRHPAFAVDQSSQDALQLQDPRAAVEPGDAAGPDRDQEQQRQRVRAGHASEACPAAAAAAGGCRRAGELGRGGVGWRGDQSQGSGLLIVVRFARVYTRLL